MWWCQTWLSDWIDRIYLLSSNVILISITSVQKKKTWSDLLDVLAIAPSWLQAYQVEGKTGWWTDWGIGIVSPSPVSPESLPLSLQEIHRLCLWQWLHQGPWNRMEEPFRIVVVFSILLSSYCQKIEKKITSKNSETKIVQLKAIYDSKQFIIDA